MPRLHIPQLVLLMPIIVTHGELALAIGGIDHSVTLCSGASLHRPCSGTANLVGWPGILPHFPSSERPLARPDSPLLKVGFPRDPIDAWPRTLKITITDGSVIEVAARLDDASGDDGIGAAGGGCHNGAQLYPADAIHTIEIAPPEHGLMVSPGIVSGIV